VNCRLLAYCYLNLLGYYLNLKRVDMVIFESELRSSIIFTNASVVEYIIMMLFESSMNVCQHKQKPLGMGPDLNCPGRRDLVNYIVTGFTFSLEFHSMT